MRHGARELLRRALGIAAITGIMSFAAPAHAQFARCTPPEAAPEARRQATLIRTVSASSQAIQGIRLSPDGRMIVIGQNDRRVRVWDIETGELLMKSRELNRPVWQVMFTQDGTRVISFGPADGAMDLFRWTIATGEGVRIEDYEGTWGLRRDGISSDSVSRDGARRFDARLVDSRLIDQTSGRDIAIVEPQDGTGVITDSFFSYDNSTLAIVYSYHTRILDAHTGEQRALLCETLNGANGGALSADGRLLIDVTPVNAETEHVAVWDTTTGAIIARVPILPGSTWDIDISADGQLIAISTQSGVTSIYRLTP